jgi:hypothetical protein
MKGKQNEWELWYLMTLNKLGKVEYEFCNNVNHIARIEFGLSA